MFGEVREMPRAMRVKAPAGRPAVSFVHVGLATPPLVVFQMPSPQNAA